MKANVFMRMTLVALLVMVNTASAQTKPASAPKPTVLSAPSDAPPTAPQPPGLTPIFDGRPLDGWVQEPPNLATLSAGDVVDLPAFIKRIEAQSDPVSSFVN